MRRERFRLVVPAVMLLAVAACGGDDESPDAGSTPTTARSVTITMGPLNNSGESGTATLTADGTKTKVVVALSGAPAGVAQPSHIHPGTCANLNPSPKYPLANTVDGSSTTTVDVALTELLAGTFAVNIHKSAQEAAVYVSCGDIKQ